MHEKYNTLENKLLLFINSCSSLLPEDVISEAIDYAVKYGEYELALDLVCYNLYENDLKIDEDTLDLLIKVASLMGINNDICFNNINAVIKSY